MRPSRGIIIARMCITLMLAAVTAMPAPKTIDPPFSSIVVDGNSGAVLQASNPDALRHPASLTKVMTLYLLFERLDAGKIKLDTPLKVSEHASEQDPTKLDLKPGQTITVEDAIKGIVTKSANDAAVAIAENLGGDEDAFAKLMTQKAHALGMTAHDLRQCVRPAGRRSDHHRARPGAAWARDPGPLPALLQIFLDRIPSSITARTIRNHDRLLDPSKGSTASRPALRARPASICSPRFTATAATLSPWSWAAPRPSDRDDRMRELISDHIKEAALRRTAPMIADGRRPPGRCAAGRIRQICR